MAEQQDWSGYFDERDRRRRQGGQRFVLYAIALIAGLVIAVLAFRTVEHVTGWNAKTTINFTSQGASTTVQKVSIVP